MLQNSWYAFAEYVILQFAEYVILQFAEYVILQFAEYVISSKMNIYFSAIIEYHFFVYSHDSDLPVPLTVSLKLSTALIAVAELPALAGRVIFKQ